jgi:hypothetical protein
MKRLKHKFNAQPCKADGIKFASKRERHWYYFLKGQQNVGEVLFFLRQVPFNLPGNTSYRCDFMVFYASGEIAFLDVKGVETPMFVMKKKQVEDLYPITIECVK